MFDPSPTARVFGLPPGVSFPDALIAGLERQLAAAPPEAMARVHLIVSTTRLARRLRDIFDAGSARLLPRISLITDLGAMAGTTILPPVSPLRRRLELVQLILKLLDAQPELAARAAAFDLADSLARLMDEMQGEGVTPEQIAALDVSDMSGHWARAQQFIGIVSDYVAGQGGRPDREARQRSVIDALAGKWAVAPPDHPVILAGSTGSRGSTLRLMQAVARLPQGAVILPGFDFDQPEAVWAQMSDAAVAEDHPQFRFSRVMQALKLSPTQIAPWGDASAPSPDRNKLLSLALRPAPFTDAWLDEGPKLPGLAEATGRLTLIEAPTPRMEALAIALRLRKAAETGTAAALITPDRMLTRRVTAILDRWRIVPDDSAGQPLHLSAPGRFLRLVARLFTDRLTAESLITLLKHPLCHSGAERGRHLLASRALELHLRRNGPPYPTAPSLSRFAEDERVTPKPDPEWLVWAGHVFCGRDTGEMRALTDWIDDLRDLAERIAQGPGEAGSGGLWQRNAGQKALAVIEAITAEAPHGGQMSARDFGNLLGALLAGEDVRDRDAPHPNIRILGTLEARVQDAELVILGGLNEGAWPEAAAPDPWLNRRLRLEAGLLLPERRIGLSAHDFQQAAASAEVVLTRASRSDDAETVASRWVSRLVNLLGGLGKTGETALAEMRRRGQGWLDLAEALDDAPRLPRATRPAPRPPLAARPRRLSVTQIKTLVRDPYAIYARKVLHLDPLNPLMRAPDALLRGIVTHAVLEEFVAETLADPAAMSARHMVALAARQLPIVVPWPMAQRLWQARIARIAPEFVAAERLRQENARPVAVEAPARLHLGTPDFTLTGRADRIDRTETGELIVYDYKTGTPPGPAEQASFDKQLLLEAAIAEQGGFEGVAPAAVAAAYFLGVGTAYREVTAPLDKEPAAKVLGELRDLIGEYQSLHRGFLSRRMMQRDKDTGDFDHLARYGEWTEADPATPEDLS